ncbi:MAG: glycosyltransferase family 39 protein [Deltaproteobacteria bacterium]|nr:glycosyltransferase family 39 protein [Deltaproteobacteria bacterium]
MTRPGRTLALTLGALTIVRLALIGRTDLIPDEAYYAIWADRLAAGYWDQPGGIAWWNALVMELLGRGATSLRIGAVVLSVVTSVFVYDLGRVTLGDAKRAMLGVLLLQALPLTSIGAVLIMHDTMLAAASAAVMACFARAVLHDEPRWWYVAAVCATIALYAKFSAVILAPAVLIAAIACGRTAHVLRRPHAYLAALGVAILFVPALAWNAQHDWVAYLAVTKLSTNAAFTLADRVASLGDFLASQVALVTPIVFGWTAYAIWLALRGNDPGRRFLAGFAATLFGYFVLQSLRAKVQGNWAALAYLPGALLAADAMIDLWERARPRKWAVAAVALAAVTTILIHVHALTPFLPIPPSADITAQSRGWKDLATRVEADARSGAARTAVLARRYQVASELRFYLPADIDVYCASYASRGTQFDIWQSFDELIGRDVIYVDYQGRAAKLFLHFDGAEDLPAQVMGSADRKLNLWRLRSFDVEGPLRGYFARPFADAVERLRRRIDEGKG